MRIVGGLRTRRVAEGATPFVMVTITIASEAHDHGVSVVCRVVVHEVDTRMGRRSREVDGARLAEHIRRDAFRPKEMEGAAVLVDDKLLDEVNDLHPGERQLVHEQQEQAVELAVEVRQPSKAPEEAGEETQGAQDVVRLFAGRSNRSGGVSPDSGIAEQIADVVVGQEVG